MKIENVILQGMRRKRLFSSLQLVRLITPPGPESRGEERGQAPCPMRFSMP
ncbi:MAG TPA: hypothetical protein VFK88_06275 [Gallionella sp.]|nr:hypothetical protein [Gallionella sp.]